MKGDFSRLTFDVTKHFSRILMQQGRVQLDADWNEQSAILLHYLQSLAKDLIGKHGGPADNLGFEIKDLALESNPPFIIGKGNYYIDGILCEVDRDYSYFDQPDYVGKPLSNGSYLVYVDVWERHISSIEDHNIREVALGGPDTATRTKLVWQVKTEAFDRQPDFTNSEGINQEWRNLVDSLWSSLTEQWQSVNRGLLKAQAKQDQTNDSCPCVTAPESRYRGAENQLYRVEIHRGSKPISEGKVQGATFKWSRDNASIVTGVQWNGAELTVFNPSGFAAELWVELINDNQELRGEAGILVKINNIDCDIVSLASFDPSLIVGDNLPTKARLWNSASTPITEDTNWIMLEDGVQIQFQPPAPTPTSDTKNINNYRTGDYWLIPARVVTGDVEWPVEDGKPKSLPPQGVEHHYAPLAILTVNSNGSSIEELRMKILPLGVAL